MLDTNMNLLATLGGVLPPSPGILATGGISQPRFDVLLLEVAKTATEGQKGKEVATVPQNVKEALLNLLTAVAKSGPEEAVRLANSPPDQEALVSQMVQKNKLQGDEEGLLLTLFQTALQRIADIPTAAKPADGGGRASRATPGTDPGPQGGTPGRPASLISPVIEGQVRQASLDAVDKPQTRIVEVAARKQGEEPSATPANGASASRAPAGEAPPVISTGNQASPQAPTTVGNPVPLTPPAAKAQPSAPEILEAPAKGPQVPVQGVPQAPVVSPRTLDPADPVVRGGQSESPQENPKPAAPPAVNPPASAAVSPQGADSEDPGRDFGNFLNQAKPKVTAAAPAPQAAPKDATPALAKAPFTPAAIHPGGQEQGKAGPPVEIRVQGPAAPPPDTKPVTPSQVRQSPESGSTDASPQGKAPQGSEAGAVKAQSPVRADTPALPEHRPQVFVSGPQPQPLVDSSTKVVLGPSANAVPSTVVTEQGKPEAPVPANPPALNQAAAGQAGNPGIVRNAQQDGNSTGETRTSPEARTPFRSAELPLDRTPSTAVQAQVPAAENHISAKSIGDLAESVVKDFQLRESVLRQVSAHLANVEKGANRLIIQLEPKQLGKLEIALYSEEGRLTARIVASNADVRDVIAANLQSFQDSLAAKGIQVQELSVAIRAQVQDGNSQPFQNQAWMFKTRTSEQEERNGRDRGNSSATTFYSPGWSHLSYLV